MLVCVSHHSNTLRAHLYIQIPAVSDRLLVAEESTRGYVRTDVYKGHYPSQALHANHQTITPMSP